MMLRLVLVATLLLMAYQDFRSRAISWLLFPLCALLILVQGPLDLVFLQELSVGFLFVAVQLLGLSLYFSFKAKRWVNITKDLLGWGDILMFFTLLFAFSALNFIIFYFSALLLACLWYILSQGLKTKQLGIPLAGIMALYYLVLLFLDQYLARLNLYNDDWVLLTLLS